MTTSTDRRARQVEPNAETRERIRRDLQAAVPEYPADIAAGYKTEVMRQQFHVGLALHLAPVHGQIADLGGGIGLFSVGCADQGLDVTLVDDFNDPVNINHRTGQDIFEIHRSRGITVVSKDVLAEGTGLAPASMDVVTSFDMMEHLHHSPKELFAEVMSVLRPGGWFVLGVPNCVNLRKRITVPLGRGKWSQMSDWYEKPVFRAHVREADVDDLHYIARDLGLTHVAVFGRNWLGYVSRYGWVRRLIPLVDRGLQRRPSLCSDLYLIGQKPTTSS